MAKKVTIRDIAAKAGVSIALVSFVMNNRVESNGKTKYRVNETTREHILEVAKQMDYQPNSAARSLRNGRFHVIGAVLADISNVYYGEIARHFEDIAYQHGYTVLFGSTDENPDKLDHIISTFINRGVDGLLIFPCEGSKKSIEETIAANVPVVMLDRDLSVAAPTVVIDNANAIRKAVDILLEKQVRHIEMFSYTLRVSSVTEREQGYLDRMHELGCDPDKIRVHQIPFDRIDATIEQIIPDILERKVEGLVFATNSLTISTVKAISQAGASISKDIQIVGFDNSEAYALFNPPISHVQQPIREICQVSTDLLFKLIDQKIEQQYSLTVLESEAKLN